MDVEDWFHILEYEGAPSTERWASEEDRVAVGLTRMLEMLDRHGVRATFFVLGWVAARHPELIAQIAERGHDVGSHGHLHALVGSLGPDGFKRDLDQSLEAISAATGRDVTSFRAPGFSITPAEDWAFEILASRGITLDASLFLAPRAHGGYPLDRDRPFRLELASGRTLLEVPTVPLRLGERSLSFAGGGYLRLWPGPMLHTCFDLAERQGAPVMLYLHPRELDPGQPRMALPPLRRFKYYVGLRSVRQRLESLLLRHRFGTLAAAARSVVHDPPVQIA
jgi:polysaccharide deacetylase family protein (PEP-CTERM system associated)